MVFGITVIAVVVITPFVLTVPYSPTLADSSAVLVPPSSAHLFGTDANGFDVFSRTVASAQRDLPIALLATLGAMVVGVALGLIASAGRGGEALMRVFDAFAALPMTLVAVVAVQLTGGGVVNIVLALLVFNIPAFMRVARGEALRWRSARFVEAAVSIGAPRLRIAVNHVLRNAYGVILVQTSLVVANAIIAVAALSFLGVGLAAPTPSWGAMIRDGMVPLVSGAWWVPLFPTLAVFLCVAALNLIAEGVEKRFEA